MATKKNKNSWMDDGDSAHWIEEKKKSKKTNVTDVGKTEKHVGKAKSIRKRISAKK